MGAIAKKAQELPCCHWNARETSFAHKAGTKGKEGLSAQTQVSNLISCLKRGGTGSTEKGNWRAFSFGAVDVTQQQHGSALGATVEHCGAKERFPTGSPRKTRFTSPRWFKKGAKMSVKSQAALLRANALLAWFGVEFESSGLAGSQCRACRATHFGSRLFIAAQQLTALLVCVSTRAL